MREGVITSLPGHLGGWTAVRDVYPIARPDLSRVVARARAGEAAERQRKEAVNEPGTRGHAREDPLALGDLRPAEQ